MPVNTIASPSRSAAAMTSVSRTEPPGWITAVAPALAASSTPSGNGKKASEATTVPTSEDCAFMTAIFTESTRLICPAPTPSVAPSFANTIALELTFRFQATGRQLQQPQVFLRHENFFRAIRKTGRGNAFHKQFRDLLCGRRIHCAVERQHAPKRRDRIARQRFQISIDQRCLLRRSAGIVVLDDYSCGMLEFRGQAPCCFQIDEIVVRKLLALQLFRGSQSFRRSPRWHVQPGGLVGIFPIP